MFRRILLFTLASVLALCVLGGGLLVWAAKRAEPLTGVLLDSDVDENSPEDRHERRRPSPPCLR